METQVNIPVTDCIYLKTNDFYCRYMYNDILYMEASGSYCNIHLSLDNCTNLTLSLTLVELQEYLPTDIFIRTHRTFIVNMNHIERILGNTIYIGEMAIPIGRDFRKDVFAHLSIVGL